MTDDVKLPRKLSEEREAPKPRRPSHAQVIEQLDRWANSPGLQPPSLQPPSLQPPSLQPRKVNDADTKAI